MVACCDESNRHHDNTRVNFRSRYKKLPSSRRNGHGFYSNGFGQLIACIFQEKYETIDRETILAPKRYFGTIPPIKTMKLWDFVRFSFVLQRKMVKFKSLPKCWHATYDRYEAFLRRSKTFLSIGGDFGVSVPVKTAPLSSEEFGNSPKLAELVETS